MATKEQILHALRTNDLAVARALVLLTARQTEDEQRQETVKYHNGIGFRPCHAAVGTSMAKFYQRNRYLTPKQIAYWRKEGKQGMRIGIYWRQLMEEAAKKESRRANV